jgi:hypothetical protein
LQTQPAAAARGLVAIAMIDGGRRRTHPSQSQTLKILNGGAIAIEAIITAVVFEIKIAGVQNSPVPVRVADGRKGIGLPLQLNQTNQLFVLVTAIADAHRDRILWRRWSGASPTA